MKLNKQICIRCCNKHRVGIWNITDEYRWEDNHIFCPEKTEHTRAHITNITIHCLYALEHIVTDKEDS